MKHSRSRGDFRSGISVVEASKRRRGEIRTMAGFVSQSGPQRQGGTCMKHIVFIVAGMIVALFVAAPVFAQSSGNFAADFDRTACVMDNSTGTLSGGIPVPLVGWTVQIKVPNSNG